MKIKDILVICILGLGIIVPFFDWPGFTTVRVVAIAISIGITLIVFTKYKALRHAALIGMIIIELGLFHLVLSEDVKTGIDFIDEKIESNIALKSIIGKWYCEDDILLNILNQDEAFISDSDFEEDEYEVILDTDTMFIVGYMSDDKYSLSIYQLSPDTIAAINKVTSSELIFTRNPAQ